MCLSSCPETTDFESFICAYDKQSTADNSTMEGYVLVGQQQCMYQLQTKSYLHRCIPWDIDVDEAAETASAIANATGVAVPSYLMVYQSAKDKGSGWFNDFIAGTLLSKQRHC